MSVTFTKLFSSITESTIWMEDLPTRITWITMLAMADRKGRIFGSVPGLAHRARVTVSECRRALELFELPDPDSRTEEFEGRRIERIDGGWRLLNHQKYRELIDEEERRIYKRDKQREYRANVDNDVDRGQLLNDVTQAEAEADAEASKSNRRFRAPTTIEVLNYSHEYGHTIDAQAFVDFYQSKNWMVGKNKMKDWKAAVRNWIRREKKDAEVKRSGRQGAAINNDNTNW